MSDQLAKEIVSLRDREKSRQSNFRSLWQSVSDLEFPQTYGIVSSPASGTELMSGLYDTTAVEEGENMASGLVNNLFPAGQKFFTVQATGELREIDIVKRYLSYLIERAHEHIFNSNFIAQVSNTIHYWTMFGMGALYSDWTAKDHLNYRDYAIGTYQCLENSKGVIDTIILTCPQTARQIYQDYGNQSGDSVLKAMSMPETANESFNVIHVVRPRSDYDPDPRLRPAIRAPWQSVYVQEKDQITLDEGGYAEFSFAVPRYQVIYGEVNGRGRGVTLLPQVRVLNRLAKDYMEMSNKWVNPPREILDTFEGNLDVTPGANNYVTTIPSVKALDMGANGMYPVTKEILEYHRETIRQGFFKSAFEAVTPLTGDRRTTTEIIERLKEGMKKLSKPMGRLFVELLTPCITRTILLLIRNGEVLQPPRELEGSPFKIEFINPLALALRDQQARGGQYWVAALGQAEAIFPGIKDNVDSDKWARDLGESLGVKTTHIRPKREVEEIRANRQMQMQEQRMAELATVGAEAYSKTTKAPEPGSPLGENA